ncbi:hypothetical protein IPL68_01085 [Candidatus Saccharibacteria bacterium]|nr:MAG: hypothetical protein IPL68_01085 [Candidatus Saccharibacteria bacterium]
MSLTLPVIGFVYGRTRLLAGATALLWVAFCIVSPYAAAQTNKEQLVAAKPFILTAVDGVAITKNSSGTPLAVTIVQGINTSVQVVNLSTMQGIARRAAH